MNPEQIEEISRLRSLNLSPKQIARNLKLRPAEVTEIVRQQAAALGLDRAARGEVAPLYNCLVNYSVAMLFDDEVPSFSNEMSGLAQVLIARINKQQLIVCSYLIDYWCLGVKDALGPRKMNQRQYEAFADDMADRFDQGFEEITIEQAQSIVFGALEYAAGLGLDPHPDFAIAKPHLGLRPNRLIPLEFGKNGKPNYINGPYDNTDKIIATLDKSVGKGNYNYTVGLGRF
jgi:hypothetical protein